MFWELFVYQKKDWLTYKKMLKKKAQVNEHTTVEALVISTYSDSLLKANIN